MVGITSKKQNKLKNINLNEEQESLIFCKSGKETIINHLSESNKINFDKCLVVQNGETVISMVHNEVGNGLISKFVLSSIPNSLIVCDISSKITMEIGLIAHSFADLTTVAYEFINVIYNSLMNQGYIS